MVLLGYTSTRNGPLERFPESNATGTQDRRFGKDDEFKVPTSASSPIVWPAVSPGQAGRAKAEFL